MAGTIIIFAGYWLIIAMCISTPDQRFQLELAVSPASRARSASTGSPPSSLDRTGGRTDRALVHQLFRVAIQDGVFADCGVGSAR